MAGIYTLDDIRGQLSGLPTYQEVDRNYGSYSTADGRPLIGFDGKMYDAREIMSRFPDYQQVQYYKNPNDVLDPGLDNAFGWGKAEPSKFSDWSVLSMFMPAITGMSGIFDSGLGLDVMTTDPTGGMAMGGASSVGDMAGGFSGGMGEDTLVGSGGVDQVSNFQSLLNSPGYSPMMGPASVVPDAGVANIGNLTNTSMVQPGALEMAMSNAGLGTPNFQMGGPAELETVGDSSPDHGMTGTPSTPTEQTWWDELKKIYNSKEFQTASTGLKLGGALYNFMQANQNAKDIQSKLNSMNNNAQNFPYQQYYDMVQQYMRDPMTLLKNNPGYLASVDYLDRAGRRTMAGKGYTMSGNKDYYIADVLGKNAQKWYSDMWQPIRDAAGVNNFQRPDQLAQVEINAMDTINKAKRDATGSLWKAGNDALPSIFKFALG